MLGYEKTELSEGTGVEVRGSFGSFFWYLPKPVVLILVRLEAPLSF